MKILVATDGSAHSMKAVQWAADFAKKSGAGTTLLAVAPFAKDLLVELPAGTQTKLEKHAQEALDKGRLVFEKLGIPVETVLEVGMVPANNILLLAQEGKFDMIVMGSTGVTGLKRALMGSTAGKVVATAPCSVTMIR